MLGLAGEPGLAVVDGMTPPWAVAVVAAMMPLLVASRRAIRRIGDHVGFLSDPSVSGLGRDSASRGSQWLPKLTPAWAVGWWRR